MSTAAQKLNHVPTIPSVLSREYANSFHTWLHGGGGEPSAATSAALYSGSDSAGGFAIPVTLANQIVPLAAPDSAIRRLATIIPTTEDLLFPVKAANSSTAAIKPESGPVAASFAEASPTLGQFLLGAFVIGVKDTVSVEFSQDVSAFASYVSQDTVLDLDAVEESLYLSGSGVLQPQGMLGNVGVGVTGAVADANGHLLSIDATYDVLDTLKAAYHSGASWLMQRATAVSLRKAALAQSLPIFTRENGQDYLHGYPVEYSAQMPPLAPGNTPVLFGNFALGYIIGERGSGLFMRVLDQLQFLQGTLPVLVYRRLDGRVRRSEAIQGITLHG